MSLRLSKRTLYEEYKNMARKIAWQYWKTLPASAKMWIDPEDMISEAVLHVMSFVGKNFNPKRSSLSTFLYCTVNSHMLNFTLAQQNGKRFGWRKDLDDVLHLHVEESLFQLIEAREALEVIFRKASPDLRMEIKKWFGPERRAPRWGVNGRALTSEFKHLAHSHRLTASDCDILLRSGVWV